MKVDKGRFPFKWIPRILTVFEGTDESFSSFQIARAIGSCGPDASEVLRILVYLTSFGKVVESEGKWKIDIPHTDLDRDQSGFRLKYIKNLDQLLNSLSHCYTPIDELTKINGRDSTEIQEELEFLAQITEKGFVFLAKTNFPQKYAFKPWNE
jgi:hypothetical protein